ncbi:MAG: SDR family oxidoreductase [Acidobacteria bacterium]|nr:SDR family oxidoreductase [Acidobacteriota bacterium]MBK9709356.1 SDR family oxidoreductase [Acidobacteriota bacterium]
MSNVQRFFLTGCASGISRHIADNLIREGHCVFATDINYEALAAHAQAGKWPEERVRLRRLDVRDPDDWAAAMEEAVEAFGKIDILMNIAGYMLAGWAHEATRESIDRHFDINVKGVIYGTQAAAKQMIKQGNGHIINIASLSALAPIPGIAIYSASKYAVRAFSLAVAQELRQHNIFVTAINPDAVNTPLLKPQEGIEAAAILFSTPQLLTVDDIWKTIRNKVIPHKPMEVTLPAGRGWLAHLTNIFPQLSFRLGPYFRKRGAVKQENFFAGKEEEKSLKFKV